MLLRLCESCDDLSVNFWIDFVCWYQNNNKGLEVWRFYKCVLSSRDTLFNEWNIPNFLALYIISDDWLRCAHFNECRCQFSLCKRFMINWSLCIARNIEHCIALYPRHIGDQQRCTHYNDDLLHAMRAFQTAKPCAFLKACHDDRYTNILSKSSRYHV